MKSMPHIQLTNDEQRLIRDALYSYRNDNLAFAKGYTGFSKTQRRMLTKRAKACDALLTHWNF